MIGINCGHFICKDCSDKNLEVLKKCPECRKVMTKKINVTNNKLPTFKL